MGVRWGLEPAAGGGFATFGGAAGAGELPKTSLLDSIRLGITSMDEWAVEKRGRAKVATLGAAAKGARAVAEWSESAAAQARASLEEPVAGEMADEDGLQRGLLHEAATAAAAVDAELGSEETSGSQETAAEDSDAGSDDEVFLAAAAAAGGSLAQPFAPRFVPHGVGSRRRAAALRGVGAAGRSTLRSDTEQPYCAFDLNK